MEGFITPSYSACDVTILLSCNFIPLNVIILILIELWTLDPQFYHFRSTKTANYQIKFPALADVQESKHDVMMSTEMVYKIFSQ